MDALSNLLATRDWLMADGATGTNLFNIGLSAGRATRVLEQRQARQYPPAVTARPSRRGRIFS